MIRLLAAALCCCNLLLSLGVGEGGPCSRAPRRCSGCLLERLPHSSCFLLLFDLQEQTWWSFRWPLWSWGRSSALAAAWRRPTQAPPPGSKSRNGSDRQLCFRLVMPADRLILLLLCQISGEYLVLAGDPTGAAPLLLQLLHGHADARADASGGQRASHTHTHTHARTHAHTVAPPSAAS